MYAGLHARVQSRTSCITCSPRFSHTIFPSFYYHPPLNRSLNHCVCIMRNFLFFFLFFLFFLFFTLPSPDIARDQRSPTIKHARQFRSRPYVSREFWCNGETYFFYCVFHWNGSVGRRIKWNEVNNFVRNVYYYYLYIERLESDRSMIKVALI